MKDHKKYMIIILAVLLLVIGFFTMTSLLFGRDDPHNAHVEDIIELDRDPIDLNRLQDINGRYFYEDDKYRSVFGIDVSTFQDVIDWKKVKEDGAEFVYIRIGRRGATTGLLYPDDMFAENYARAKENGLLVGVYFFSQALNEKEAREEADYVLQLLGDRKIDLEIAYDLEEVYVEDETPRIEGIEKDQFTANALTFLKEIESHGYQGLIYTYPYWAETFYDMEQLKAYPVWYACDRETLQASDYPVMVWQYDSAGKISGIKENVDMNIMFIRKEK